MAKIVSRQRMGYFALTFHWCMILGSCGLWYPIYASIRRSRSTVTYMPAAHAQHPGYGQHPGYAPPVGAPYPPYGHPQQQAQPQPAQPYRYGPE